MSYDLPNRYERSQAPPSEHDQLAHLVEVEIPGLEAELDMAREYYNDLRIKHEQLREALIEARRTFDVLLEIGADNSLWRNVASVGAKDAAAALAATEDRQEP